MFNQPILLAISMRVSYDITWTDARVGSEGR